MNIKSLMKKGSYAAVLLLFAQSVRADVAGPAVFIGLFAIIIIGVVVAGIAVGAFFFIRWLRKRNKPEVPKATQSAELKPAAKTETKQKVTPKNDTK